MEQIDKRQKELKKLNDAPRHRGSKLRVDKAGENVQQRKEDEEEELGNMMLELYMDEYERSNESSCETSECGGAWSIRQMMMQYESLSWIVSMSHSGGVRVSECGDYTWSELGLKAPVSVSTPCNVESWHL